MDGIKNNFSTWLKKQRKKFNVSREELGNAIGITASTVGQIERGEIKRPPMTRLQKISMFFKVSLNKIKMLFLKTTEIIKSISINTIVEKYILMFSGGKDSTAMLDIMVMNNIYPNEVIFADISAEFQEIYEHLTLVEKLTGVNIKRIKTKYTMNQYMLEYIKVKGKTKGEVGYGWCGKCRWGTTMKKQTIHKYLKEQRKQYHIVEYHGIAFDEPRRLQKNNDGRDIRYPLVDLKMTEKQALDYCYRQGYTWGGLYELLDRVSCWCCQNKNIRELRNYYNKLPEYWDKLKQLEKDIGEPYRVNKPLQYFENVFKEENRQMEFVF